MPIAHSGNGSAPLFNLRFVDLRTRIVFHGYVYLTRWSFGEKLAVAPYWRLYWNDEPGAAIVHDGVRHSLDPSSIFLIPPETAFAAMLDKPTHHFHVHFIVENSSLRVAPGVIRLAMSRTRRAMIDRVISLSLESRLESPEGGCAVLELIYHLLGHVPPDAWLRQDFDPRVTRAIAIMESSDDPRSVGNHDLAQAVNMSDNAFIRLFSQQTKLPPMRYFLKQRLSRAASMLMHDDHSIDQIADLCGFCDRAHFSKSFKRAYGLNPAEYCRTMRPF